MPSASRTRGRSRWYSWSCNALVPVEMIVFIPDSSAGTRYANVLPVPVPASASSTSRVSNASAIASVSRCCAARGTKPGMPCASGPPSASAARLRVTSSTISETVWAVDLAGVDPGLGRGRTRAVARDQSRLFDRRPVAPTQRPTFAPMAYAGARGVRRPRSRAAAARFQHAPASGRDRPERGRAPCPAPRRRPDSASALPGAAPARAGLRPSGRAAAGLASSESSWVAVARIAATIASGDAFVSATGATGGGVVVQAPNTTAANVAAMKRRCVIGRPMAAVAAAPPVAEPAAELVGAARRDCRCRTSRASPNAPALRRLPAPAVAGNRDRFRDWRRRKAGRPGRSRRRTQSDARPDMRRRCCWTAPPTASPGPCRRPAAARSAGARRCPDQTASRRWRRTGRSVGSGRCRPTPPRGGRRSSRRTSCRDCRCWCRSCRPVAGGRGRRRSAADRCPPTIACCSAVVTSRAAIASPSCAGAGALS